MHGTTDSLQQLKPGVAGRCFGFLSR